MKISRQEKELLIVSLEESIAALVTSPHFNTNSSLTEGFKQAIETRRNLVRKITSAPVELTDGTPLTDY